MTDSLYPIMILAVLVGYVITSIFFLKYPNLLHRKKCAKFKARHISHRGGAGENLENTMTAFQHSCHIGADMLEMDCQMTKDEKVVVSHDNHLKRSCGCDAYISDFNYIDLPPIHQSLRLDFMNNHVTVAKNGDRRIPLLEEVFEAFPDTPINVDIKVNNDLLIHKVSELIKKYGREDITVWGNKTKPISDKCYKENPNIPRFFCLKQVIMILVLFFTGLLPFVPLKGMFFEIFMPGMVLNRKIYNIEGFSRLFFFVVDRILMRASLVKHLEKRGIQTFIWVLNDEEEFQRAFQCGATGVMTDFPTKLIKYLEEHPQAMTVH